MKKLFVVIDENSRRLLDRSRLTHPLYEKVILPFEVMVYQMGNYKIIPAFKREVDDVLNRYKPDWMQESPQYLSRLEKDMVKVHICNRMSAEEYFLYDFEHQDYWQRWDWLSDYERTSVIDGLGNKKAFEELTDKSQLYAVANNYFHREMCVLSAGHAIEDFLSFVSRHQRFIVKPIDGMTGHDARIVAVKSVDEAKTVFRQLITSGAWVAEELIRQHPAMARWNETSVNTLRVPTFRTSDGCRILQPFFRTGRKGSVVDNAGQGGVFAVFDPDSGVITTDGVDEYGGRYETHPDSGIRFKGWQIPRYDEMKKLAAEIIHILPSQPRYVGFDFALTDTGWVLVEGNYNGQFVGQMAEQKGVRRKFFEYISLSGDK